MLSKEQQIAEGKARSEAIKNQGAEADPQNDLIADPSAPPDPEPGRQIEQDEHQGGPQGRPKPIYMSPADEMRANIAKRFRRDADGEVPFNGDLTDPEMLYGKHGRPPEQQVDPVEPEPEPEPAPQPAPQPQPKMRTLKVRGQDVTKSEEEWLADAAKVTAADSYLEESRQILENARQIKRDRENGERAPADPHRPEDQTNTQDGRTDPSLSADPHHPEDELEGAIEEIRYGTDPKEAAKRLDKAIEKRADKAADERQLRRLIGNDAQRAQKAMLAFSEANPDIANDKFATQVITQEVYDIQREELKAMGIEESKLPKDSQTVALWHQFQRVHGHPVSSPEQMLEKAKDRFLQWKGGKPSPQPQPQSRKEAPRVEVNVNRDDRRAQLPNQPTRSAVPPPTRQNPQNSATPRTRSDVISGMRKARGQIVA